MAFKQKTVAPMPYKAPAVDDSGFLTSAWSTFFRDLYERVGGRVAYSNVDLATLQTADITTLQTTVTALQATVTALSASVTTNNSTLQTEINDLSQGPNL